jgi:hypothetical protein
MRNNDLDYLECILRFAHMSNYDKAAIIKLTNSVGTVLSDNWCNNGYAVENEREDHYISCNLYLLRS